MRGNGVNITAPEYNNQDFQQEEKHNIRLSTVAVKKRHNIRISTVAVT